MLPERLQMDHMKLLAFDFKVEAEFLFEEFLETDDLNLAGSAYVVKEVDRTTLRISR